MNNDAIAKDYADAIAYLSETVPTLTPEENERWNEVQVRNEWFDGESIFAAAALESLLREMRPNNVGLAADLAFDAMEDAAIDEMVDIFVDNAYFARGDRFEPVRRSPRRYTRRTRRTEVAYR